MLSTLQEKLLCDGYGRENCVLSIPIVITKLYTIIIALDVNNKKLKQLINGQQIIYHKPFRVKEITFQCYLERNGDIILFCCRS